MPLKIIISIVFSITILQKSNAQDSCIYKEYSFLKRLIERNIAVGGETYANTLSEYFVIDIKLDSETKAISTIDFLRKNNSCHYKQIENLIDKIRQAWNNQSCHYNRILIPLFLLFSSAEKLSDYPPDLSLKEQRAGLNDKTYIGDIIVINIFSTVKKKESL